MLENISNNIKRVKNALRGNEEEPNLEVNKTSNRLPTLRRTMAKVLKYLFCIEIGIASKTVALIS